LQEGHDDMKMIHRMIQRAVLSIEEECHRLQERTL
jgi:hypothetical protein